MKTSPVAPADLSASVLAVPPLANLEDSEGPVVQAAAGALAAHDRALAAARVPA